MNIRVSKTRFSRPLTAVVLAIWAVIAFSLVKDSLYPAVQEAVNDKIKISEIEVDDWFVLRIGGAYSGYGRSRQIKDNDQWILRDDMNIALNIQGQVKPIRISSESHVDRSFRLVSFKVKVSSGIISFEHKGHMEGRDLILQLPSFQGGGTKKIKLHEVPRISRSLGLPMPITGLTQGEEIHLPIFDPMDGQKWDAVINVLEQVDLEVMGQKVRAWRLRATFRAMEVIMWVDDDGRLLKGRMPLNITVVRSDKSEIARQTASGKELPEMMSLSSVPLEGSLPENSDLKLLRLEIKGSSQWAIPSNDFRQKLSGTEVIISKEDEPRADYALPSKDPKMDQHLAASRFLRSDEPTVIKKAREIVGDEKDPVKAAKLINEWVYKNLKKIPTPSIPDAYAVLESRQGDCNEHAVLAASLARAVGLPARIAVGLIHGEDGFYYHAWVEYWGGKNWFTGDPLTGILPVPPTYVTLLYGDIDKHMNVLNFLGRLKLKLVEAK